MRIKQAEKIKTLGHENTYLKKLGVDISLDNAMLKEVSEENF